MQDTPLRRSSGFSFPILRAHQHASERQSLGSPYGTFKPIHFLNQL